VRLEGGIADYVLKGHEVISIPQRCDWKMSNVPRCTDMRPFQYLKGAIGSCRFARGRERAGEISIPQRCDWKKSCRRISTRAAAFQYLKGAIGSVLGTALPVVASAFQYLKGAIGRPTWPGWWSCSASFQYLKGAIGSC